MSELTWARSKSYRAEVRLQLLPTLTYLVMLTHEPAPSVMTDGVTVSHALDLLGESGKRPSQRVLVNLRVLRLCCLAIMISFARAIASCVLINLSTLITSFAVYQCLSFAEGAPAEPAARLGLWIILIPVIGALIVGLREGRSHIALGWVWR